ncbi:cyclic nucleotide-binding domain-containing protein [Stenomitos frigidus]|uniref:Cyclic nucleotide-binding protein n=1 Tax=Stenomitos frigidus ULC18 TaxID=2107698 RepID=A0A2T1E9A0_9CYAN|nr:cyclic nucleotide-binding domain-containing protein [Stenomitos frigidus]PSB29327.1 cyclic nucleotide-binding protein [Stenomitos frigidus ULC18]
MKKVLFILGELDDDDIDWVIETAVRQDVVAGTVLIYEGQPIDTLYILLEGTLSVSVAAMGDREIAQLSSGDVVGEMSFIDTRPPSATVTATQPSLVLSLPREQLATKLRQDVGFASRFYRALAIFLSNRLRVTVNQLGYGSNNQSETTDLSRDDLTRDAKDNVALAETRLDWLLRRLKGR